MAGCRLGQDPSHLVEVEGEVGGALADRHAGAGDAGDVAVQRVGRLEHRDGAAGAAVGEAQRLEHLVGAVGGEDLLGADAVDARRCASRSARRGAVGVAVPVERRPARRPAPSAKPAGGGSGASLVLSRTATSTCGEW